MITVVESGNENALDNEAPNDLMNQRRFTSLKIGSPVGGKISLLPLHSERLRLEVSYGDLERHHWSQPVCLRALISSPRMSSSSSGITHLYRLFEFRFIRH